MLIRFRSSLCAYAVVLLAACSTLPLPEPREEEAIDEAPQRERNATLKHLDKRNLKPMPIKPITVSSRCSQKDEQGTTTRLNLKVKDSKVLSLNASIEIPKHGSCRFDLSEFEQTAVLPQLVLTHRTQSQCNIRMWAQDQQIAIAYTTCAQACSGDSFDYLWPTLVDSRSGRCD